MIKKVNEKMVLGYLKLKNMMSCKRGEGYVDSGVKILIAVVIGALLLGLLYSLFNESIMPKVTSKIASMFEYSGK